MKNKYTIIDVSKAIGEAQYEIGVVLQYICNKNSHPLPRGVDFANLFDEIQDLENYLLTKI